MIEFIFLAIFIVSFISFLVFITKRIPVLADLSVLHPSQSKIAIKIKRELKERKTFGLEGIELLLQKVLSKIKVLVLKIEKTISDWLHKLRQRKIKKDNNIPSDNYWDKMKE